MVILPTSLIISIAVFKLENSKSAYIDFSLYFSAGSIVESKTNYQTNNYSH